MKEPKTKQIEVPFRQEQVDAPAKVEILDVRELGPNHYQLVYSPGLVEGLAAGDEFELCADAPLGFRILQRSGNLCVWFFFQEPGQNRGTEGAQVRAAVERMGGVCDGGMGFVLVFTIPISVGIPVVVELFDELVSQYEGACWMFGNVYDPNDGVTPLNWWE